STFFPFTTLFRSPIASMIAGRLLLVFGYRNTSLIGGFSLVIGGLIFFSLTPEKGPIWAGMGSFLIGMGMGFTQTPFIVAIQSAVGGDMRGSATAANTFMRSLGSAIGADFLGGLFNSRIQSTIIENKLENELSIDAVNHLLDPNKTAQYSDLAEQVLQEGLVSGLHIVYTGLLFLAIISCILILYMPNTD